MSYYLIDLSNKSPDFNFDDFIIGKKIRYDNERYRHYIYIQNEMSETPKEIYIRLPKIRLLYNIANNKFKQLSIPLYPNCELINNSIEFINKLESNIEECFTNKNLVRDFTSIISKKSLLNYIKMDLTDKIKITSNIKNQKITFNDFRINGEIEIVLKLSYIWGKLNKIGLSSQLYQIKYYAPPEQLNIDFLDFNKQEEISNPIIYNVPNIPAAPLLDLEKFNKNQDINTNKTFIKMVPTQKDLEQSIKKLRKTNKKI